MAMGYASEGSCQENLLRRLGGSGSWDVLCTACVSQMITIQFSSRRTTLKCTGKHKNSFIVG